MRGTCHGQSEPVLHLHQLRVPQPTKHDKDCAPCTAKNHRLREIPNGFFNMVEGADKHTGGHFEDFARSVLEHPVKCPETQHQARGVTTMPGEMALILAPRAPHLTASAMTRFTLQRLAS